MVAVVDPPTAGLLAVIVYSIAGLMTKLELGVPDITHVVGFSVNPSGKLFAGVVGVDVEVTSQLVGAPPSRVVGDMGVIADPAVSADPGLV